MLDYTDYTVEQLILHEAFRKWVLHPEDEDVRYWNEWLNRYPHRRADVARAARFVRELHDAHEELSDDELREEVGKLAALRRSAKPVRRTFGLFRVAAAVAVLVLAGYAFFHYRDVPATAYEAQKERLAAVSTTTEVANSGSAEQPVTLPDGSVVTLAPGSRISYAKAFDGATREVTLSGEAFFQVVRRPEQPFLVYANDLVTKVLGTSFRIRAFEADREVKVIVKTGKVSVFRNKTTEGTLFLTPNQQATFDREDGALASTLVSRPEPVVAPPVHAFTFDHTPVAEALGTLGKVYGVQIDYDARALERCEINAEMDRESLFEKLDLICKAIDARYEVTGTKIIIHAKGC